MKTSATNRRLRILLTGIQNGSLLPRPEFQRRLVWANKHKIAFLKTVLEGYPFPEIYIASGDVDSDTGEGTEMLVDGQQRISTLYQYFKASQDLKLGKSIRPYKDLSQEEKLSFLDYEVVVRDLGNLPVSHILEIFQRINSTNYALNAMEIHNARFDGELKQLGEALASHSIFENKRFFSTRQIRRMEDTRFCLTLTITLLSGYTNRDDALEKYLEKYNEEFDQKNTIEEQFNKVAAFLLQCNFEPTSRFWNKADFYSVFVELHRAIFKRKISLEPKTVYKQLVAFFDSLEKAIKSSKNNSYETIYYKATIQASNDRGSRIKRGEIIQWVIDNTYEPKVNIELSK